MFNINSEENSVCDLCNGACRQQEMCCENCIHAHEIIIEHDILEAVL